MCRWCWRCIILQNELISLWFSSRRRSLGPNGAKTHLNGILLFSNSIDPQKAWQRSAMLYGAVKKNGKTRYDTDPPLFSRLRDAAVRMRAWPSCWLSFPFVLETILSLRKLNRVDAFFSLADAPTE